MQWLTADPPPIEMQSVGWINATSAEYTASLSRLPSLTSLSGDLALADASFIGRLTRLQTVQLFCQPQVDLQQLLAVLAQCSSMSDLSLAHPQLSVEHLASLLPRLSQHSLTICGPQLRFLTFLSLTPHLASTLRELKPLCSSNPLSLCMCTHWWRWSS